MLEVAKLLEGLANVCKRLAELIVKLDGAPVNRDGLPRLSNSVQTKTKMIQRKLCRILTTTLSTEKDEEGQGNVLLTISMLSVAASAAASKSPSARV